jgi:uncharacterized protein YbaA (DUF1428 family)
MSYISGFVVAVPTKNKEAYRRMAADMADIFKEYGAHELMEAWGDVVRDGKVTDFKRAVQATPNESVVFSFVEWPNKATRDEGWTKVMKDPRMQPDPQNMPFDGKRRVWGGVTPLLDE